METWSQKPLPRPPQAGCGRQSAKVGLADAIPNQFTWPEHPDDDHLFNLAIHAQAQFLVTWETRILKLSEDPSKAATELRRLAPHLQMITPTGFVKVIYSEKI